MEPGQISSNKCIIDTNVSGYGRSVGVGISIDGVGEEDKIIDGCGDGEEKAHAGKVDAGCLCNKVGMM